MLRWILFFLPVFIFASGPWFTGPLLTPSGEVNEMGQISWQPYLFVRHKYGEYTSGWGRKNTPNVLTIRPLIDVTYGVLPFMDIEAFPSFAYKRSEGISAVGMSDTPILIGFQVLRESYGPYIPDLRVRIIELLPFGKYDKLSRKKNGLDGEGLGSYQTGVSFDFQKLFHITHDHYFRLRFAFEWFFYPAPVHIKGLSVYGGTPKTRGRVTPGKSYFLYLSGEYTLTQHWVFATDLLYAITEKDRFSGKTGAPPGTTVEVGSPSSQQISLAPAIEYNFTENFGLIGGAWFSVAGKNSGQFVSGVLSVVITY